MSGRNLETMLSFHCLTGLDFKFYCVIYSWFGFFLLFTFLFVFSLGPLMNNPVCERDKAVNKLRLKYKTYIVEYDVEVGAVVLPSMFANDFGDRINCFVKLIDPKDNQFEVLVENIIGSFFLTKGWKALCDFYGIGWEHGLLFNINHPV